MEVEYEGGAPLGELPYHGYPGRAAALRAILQTAQRAGARACAVIDSGLQGVSPEWIERLVGPALTDGFDYVSPYYTRHVNEGDITKGIVYPMFRALYGVRLRQPAAGEFGCSGRLVTHYLQQDFWDVEQASVGIDFWLAAAAVCGEFRTCEAALGARASSRGTPADLSTTLAQVVGALFADLETHAEVWQRVRGSVAIPVFGTVPAIGPEAPPLNVDGLIDSFRLGYRELREIWTWVLPPRTIVELRKLTETRARAVSFRRSALGEHRLRLCARLQPSSDAARPPAPLVDTPLHRVGGVVRSSDGKRQPGADRRARRAALQGFRIGEASPHLAVALARAASLIGPGRTGKRTKRSSHVGTS